jgi:hypothetical protein
MLKWISFHNIDRAKWDACIQQCEWGKVYAQSFFLDQISNHQWEALVWGDYEVVMPVPYRVKWGIRYCYRPNFCQQLGIFSRNNEITDSRYTAFYSAFFEKYQHGEYPLNHKNIHLPKSNDFKKRTNFILNLQPGYDSISKNFAGDLVNNLKKAEKAGLEFKTDIPISDVIEVYNGAWQHLNPIPDSEYNQFANIAEKAIKNDSGKTFGVYYENNLVAACCTLNFKNRIYYPFSGITELGKKMGATAFMINEIIKINAGQNLTLDFEGSDIESVQYFYGKFRPGNEPYYQITRRLQIKSAIKSLLKRW